MIWNDNSLSKYLGLGKEVLQIQKKKLYFTLDVAKCFDTNSHKLLLTWKEGLQA